MKHEKFSNAVETNEERVDALESARAQNILPYLTLEKLSNTERRDLLDLSSYCLSLMEKKKLPEDKMLRLDIIESIIAEISGENKSWDTDRIITPKLAEARKLFCASLLDATNNQDNPDAKWEIYESFFGVSPDLSSYCGRLRGSLELLTIAERTFKNPCSREIYDEIVYDYSFSDVNDFEKILSNSNPISQLSLLPIYTNIAIGYCDPDNYSRGALTKIDWSLEKMANDKEATPLVRIVAESAMENIRDFHDAEWVFMDEDDPDYLEWAETNRKRQEVREEEQDTLHQKFQSLPPDQPIAMIAPGIAATLYGSTVNTITNDNGENFSLLDYSKENPFGIDRDMALLIGAAHIPGVKNIIDKRIGMKLEEIPLAPQMQFLKFMAEAKNERFDNLCSTLNTIDDASLRKKLLENFVAAGFGDDFGDSLLTIASSERLSSSEKERILDMLDSCRKSIGGITDLYKDMDSKFAEEYTRAANERLTDAVTVFSEIAKHDKVEADLGWAGEPKFNYDTAMEALEYEAKSLKIINCTISDVRNKKPGAFAEVVLSPDLEYQSKNRTVYNFYSPDYGYVLLHTRPEGSEKFDAALEYGKTSNKYNRAATNVGTEASISFITNPKDPFSLPNPYRPNSETIKNPNFYNGATMDKVSALRLDREGRVPGAVANDASRSPINFEGMISVDLAAIGDRADTPSGKIARLVSVGNKLRATVFSGETSLNHNTNYFDQMKYGTETGFRKIVQYLDSVARGWCRSMPPKDSEGFTGAMAEIRRKQNQARGARIIKDIPRPMS